MSLKHSGQMYVAPPRIISVRVFMYGTYGVHINPIVSVLTWSTLGSFQEISKIELQPVK